jgi:hypothetical protein
MPYIEVPGPYILPALLICIDDQNTEHLQRAVLLISMAHTAQGYAGDPPRLTGQSSQAWSAR